MAASGEETAEKNNYKHTEKYASNFSSQLPRPHYRPPQQYIT